MSALFTTSLEVRAFVGIDIGADMEQFEPATKDNPDVKSSSMFRGSDKQHIYAGLTFWYATLY